MNASTSSAPRVPLHPLSALALAFADWLATGLNIATAMDAYWAVAIGAAILGGLSMFAIERRIAHSPLDAAAVKVCCAVPLILLPFPFAGSLAALGLLAWALYDWLAQRPRD